MTKLETRYSRVQLLKETGGGGVGAGRQGRPFPTFAVSPIAIVTGLQYVVSLSRRFK